MKRLLILLAVASLLMAVTVTPNASADKLGKVEICHVNSASKVPPDGFGGLPYFGTVIRVSRNAVGGHEVHGDSTEYADLTEDLRLMFEDVYYVSLQENADCFFGAQ